MRSTMALRVLAAVAVVATMGGMTSATPCDPVILRTQLDTTVFETDNAAADVGGAGGASTLYLGQQTDNGGLRRMRMLLKFDLSTVSSCQQGVATAQLSLEVTKIKNTQHADLAVHRVTTPWTTGSGQFSQAKGMPAPQPSDATWHYASFDGTQWQTPGGDFDTTAIATHQLPAACTATPCTREFEEDALVSYVEDVRSGAKSDHGLILLGDENSQDGGTAQIFSASSITLTITFRAPPPAGWTCKPSWYGDGRCDGGCGVADVDCPVVMGSFAGLGQMIMDDGGLLVNIPEGTRLSVQEVDAATGQVKVARSPVVTEARLEALLQDKLARLFAGTDLSSDGLKAYVDARAKVAIEAYAAGDLLSEAPATLSDVSDAVTAAEARVDIKLDAKLDKGATESVAQTCKETVENMLQNEPDSLLAQAIESKADRVDTLSSNACSCVHEDALNIDCGPVPESFKAVGCDDTKYSGNTCTLSCTEGYTGDDAEFKCNILGQWEGDIVCHPDCDPAALTGRAAAACPNKLKFGETCTKPCDNGLDGSVSVTCGAGGAHSVQDTCFETNSCFGRSNGEHTIEFAAGKPVKVDCWNDWAIINPQKDGNWASYFRSPTEAGRSYDRFWTQSYTNYFNNGLAKCSEFLTGLSYPDSNQMAQAESCSSCHNVGSMYATTGEAIGCTYYNRNCDMQAGGFDCYSCPSNNNNQVSAGTCSHRSVGPHSDYPSETAGGCGHWWNRVCRVGIQGKYCVCYRSPKAVEAAAAIA